MDSLKGSPVAKLVPPGQCQFGEDFRSVKLVDKVVVTESSSLLRFALPDTAKPLQLSTCACILAKAKINGEDVVRPYTPVSTNALTGHFDLLVKNYFEKGTMSTFLSEKLQVGDDSVSFSHIPFNVKIQAPFDASVDHIIMLTGGSGITPMIQALHAILGSPDKSQKVTMLYGSQTSSDILGQALLDDWAKEYPDQLEIVHILSNEPDSSDWTGRTGFINQTLLEAYLPADRSKTMFFVCGPPPMYDALSGPRTEPEIVGGLLGKMGFISDQVYKF